MFSNVRVPNLIAIVKMGSNDRLLNNAENIYSDVAEAVFRQGNGSIGC